jgi:N-glycosidase YbiA
MTPARADRVKSIKNVMVSNWPIIKFYEGDYALLSNFSAHQVEYNGFIFQTAEHAYQVSKFSNPDLRERITQAPSAYLAREYGQSDQGRTLSFDKVRCMKEIMRAKLEQHNDVYNALITTGEAKIEKNHPLDSFWGTGSDGKGKNMMGIIWMELRGEIQPKLLKLKKIKS